jgi:hypothetical protein
VRRLWPSWSRRTWLTAIGVIVLLLVAGTQIFLYRAQEPARARVIALLEERFQSEVELGSLSLRLLPRPFATGENLVFRHKRRADVPPLVTLHRFSAELGWSGLFGKPVRVRNVTLEGLVIHVPPRKGDKEDDDNERDEPKRQASSPFVIEKLTADGTLLKILSKKPGKDPLEFDIHSLDMQSVGVDRPMRFQAILRNAKPPGDIHSNGEFGPWQAGEPGLTPVSGTYTFHNADLSDFKGISGILSSEGKYEGILNRIVVDGWTDTPKFMLKVSGHPVHLKTEFHAIVDGTDGDTKLQPVTARFLRSRVVARGDVAGRPGVKGKTVSLDATVQRGRVEDMLHLAVKSDKPTMVGEISFRSKIVIPPGDVDIAEKLQLKGTFGMESAKFTSNTVQTKVADLSRRARGEPKEPLDTTVTSDFAGAFTLANGTVTFSDLVFQTPGASVRLNGGYGLQTEELDFRGRVRMLAPLSKTTTGWKSLLLKAVDPFFKKNGAGAEIPIKITGTRDQPQFGLALGGGDKEGKSAPSGQ